MRTTAAPPGAAAATSRWSGHALLALLALVALFVGACSGAADTDAAAPSPSAADTLPPRATRRR